MDITVEDLPPASPGKNPLLETPQYAAQLAGSSVFFQVISKLTESPVRIIIHDRLSGKRKLIVIKQEEPKVSKFATGLKLSTPKLSTPVVLADKPVVLADKPVVLADKPVVLADKPVVLADKPVVSPVIKSPSIKSPSLFKGSLK